MQRYASDVATQPSPGELDRVTGGAVFGFKQADPVPDPCSIGGNEKTFSKKHKTF